MFKTNPVLSSSPVTLQTLETQPNKWAIQLSRVDDGWRLTSQKNRFVSFTITTQIVHYYASRKLYPFQGYVAYFPDIAALFEFDSGSVLLVYLSGHIRWITALGLKYYAVLSQGAQPCCCQGDLVLFALEHKRLIPHRHTLSSMLPPDQSTIWCQARPAISVPHKRTWTQVEEIPLGGNTRHKATGCLRFSNPIPNDHRSMQIHTLDKVLIQHDPVDEIHPTICLPPHQDFLVTKLPGFSDPIREMKPNKEVSP